ncbi:MAG: cation diffusion facilitator family transporter [Vibrionaceae bacterium]
MSENYSKWVQIAAWSAMLTAIFLILVKLFSWWYTNSVSLQASLMDSSVDLLASLTNLLALRYALKPADAEHRFGHGKAEALAALAQSAFVLGSACFLFLSSIERFLRPNQVSEAHVGIWISALAAVVTLVLVLFQKWVVRKTGSQAIAADSLHYQADLWMNIAIMGALGLTSYGIYQADIIFAMGIATMILFSAYKIAYQAVQSLLDKRLPIEEQEKIFELVRSVPGVIDMHNLRTRQSGATRFIQLHLELDDAMTVLEAHHIADQVETKLAQHFLHADIHVHQEPISVAMVHRLELGGER